ncbi:PLDc N-terminal domain-containing protein [Natrinema gari]|uniref:Membrane protein n=1 Tax=Natrinema gari JCM 14663 TaxID=1230459 RepID=L9Z4K7_9EURY|nr:PLDc N-terminal domain-containing protein [Natrinema gari]ELY80118.1 membrane protein [Natrinema gari JCM 14663]
MVPLTALFPMQVAGGGILLVVLLLFVIQIGALVWVYFDAQTNSPHSAVLWTLVVFFGGLLGLLLYVLLGREKQRGRSSHQTQF